MMIKNPTFSTLNQAFKKLIEKQNTENRMSHPAMIDLKDGTQYNLHLDQISNQTIPWSDTDKPKKISYENFEERIISQCLRK